MGTWGCPRWFPMYAAAVIFATLSPLLPICQLQRVSFTFHAFDGIANGLLFVPFGVALRDRRRSTVWLIALGSAAAIEATQMFLPRTPNPFDIVANIAGAAVGWQFGSTLSDRVTEWPAGLLRWLFLALAWVVVGALVANPTHRLSHDFSSWRSQPLGVGARGAERGAPEIAEIALFDRAVEPPVESPVESADGSGPARWSEGGPMLWLRFTPQAEGWIEGPAGRVPIAMPDGAANGSAQGARIAGFQLDDKVAREVDRRLRETGRFSIRAQVRPADPPAAERSRILSLGRDLLDHSFTLEQDGAAFDLRVSTPSDGVNVWLTELRAEVDGPEFHRLLAVYEGPVARMYLDDSCRGEVFYALEYHAWPFAGGIAITLFLAISATVLAAYAWVAPVFGRGANAGVAPGILGVAPGLLALLAGGMVWGGLWFAGAWRQMPGFDPIAAGIGGIALLVAWPLLAIRSESRDDR